MTAPVDLLLITHNRREYVQMALPRLLEDPADFRLHWWDNHSTDGTRDWVAAQSDPRIVERHLHPENVNQREPCLWFFERARSDLVGKVDDDILLPPGWIERIAPLLRAHAELGMLGCWAFMQEDWDERLARRNALELGGQPILRCVVVQGHSFLARREHLRRYAGPVGSGIPVRRARMALDGLISGYPLPPLFAHNMDDPRSPHCRTAWREPLGEEAALTARTRGFHSAEEYAAWIAADARARLEQPYARQLFWLRLDRSTSFGGRLLRSLLGPFRRGAERGET